MFKDLRPYPALAPDGPAWARDLPAHWQARRGKTLFRRLVRPVRPDDGVITCFRDGVVTLRSLRRTTGFTEALQEIGYQGVRTGDLVIHAMDAFAGAVGVSNRDGKCSPVYAVCEPRSGAEPGYFAALIREMARSQWIAALSRGVRERSTDFRYETFAAERLPSPPVHEQAAIVRYLAHAHRRIDRTIAAKRKLIALLEEQKRAIINQAVTRGLDPAAPFKDTGIPSLGHIPAHWLHSSVGRVQVLVTSGSRGWSEYYSDAGALFIQSGNLGRDLALDLARLQRVDLPTRAEGVRTEVRKGDVLVCITGALTGNVVHVRERLGEPAFVNQHVALVRLRSDVVDSRFVAYFMRSAAGQRQFGAAEYGGTKQGLGLADVKGVSIPIPPVDEQRKIAIHIDAETGTADAAIDRIRREIDLLREFRTRLTSDVVTGQLDVRHIAATLPDLDPAEPAGDVGPAEDDLVDEAAEFLEGVDA